MYSEYSQYYHEFACANQWADPDADRCGCRGRGWWASDLDTWHQCPYHGKDVHHPECECPECTGYPAPTIYEPVEMDVFDDPEAPCVPDEEDLPF